MKNDFDIELKNIEEELLNLKTASKYVSIKNAYSASIPVTTGLYRITYAASDEPIISTTYKGIAANHGYYYLRTPGTNTQIVEVLTTYWSNEDQTYYTDNNSIIVISNRKVLSIVRI